VNIFHECYWTFLDAVRQTADMIDVLVLGDVNPDLVLQGDLVPKFGQAEQLLDSADLVLGGSAAITAHALARLGRRTRLAAAVGPDLFGRTILDLLRAGGVDTDAIFVSKELCTGLTVVLSRGHDRAILTHLGAISSLSAGQAEHQLAAAARDGARHLHVSSYFLLGQLAGTLPHLLATAHSLGLTTSLDTNNDPSGQWNGLTEVLPELDYFLPNCAETLAVAARLTGESGDDVRWAATTIARHGPTVVVKAGPRGALQVEPDGSVLYESGTPVSAVDTTGAGDTFNAAYLDSVLRGLGQHECLRRATRAGALSTQAVGGTAGQPTLQQLLPNTEG